MPLTGLIIHSMSIIASFKYQVLFRSLLFIFLFSFYFKIDENIIFSFKLFNNIFLFDYFYLSQKGEFY